MANSTRVAVACPSCGETRMVAPITAANIRKGYHSGRCHRCAQPNNHKNEHRLYSVWASMKARCRNPRDRAYANYGGRGIVLCERWDDFDNFAADMFPSYSEGLTLDRIDNDGHYSPENCRWATRPEQLLNTRRNKMLTHDGRTMTLTEWAREIGVPPRTLASRLRYGFTLDEALRRRNGGRLMRPRKAP